MFKPCPKVKFSFFEMMIFKYYIHTSYFKYQDKNIQLKIKGERDVHNGIL